MKKKGTAEGTPFYISPEQAKGDNINYRTDIYSLGATFYHLLCGAPPFVGSNAKEIMNKHIFENIIPLHKRSPSIPRKYTEIVDKMLYKNPADRYSDAALIVADIEKALKGEELVSAPPCRSRGFAGLLLSSLRNRVFLKALLGISSALIVFFLLVLFLSSGPSSDNKVIFSKDRTAEMKKIPRRIVRIEHTEEHAVPIEEIPFDTNMDNIEENARARLDEAVSFMEENPEEIEKAVVYFESIIKEYGKTAASAEAVTYLESLRANKATHSAEEMEKIHTSAQNLLSEGKFADCAELWKFFSSKNRTSAAQDIVKEELSKIEQLNLTAIQQTGQQINDLLKKGEFNKAEEITVRLYEQSIENLKPEAEQLKNLVESSMKKHLDTEQFRQTIVQFNILISECKFEDAAAICNSFILSSTHAELNSEIMWRIDAANRAAKAKQRLFSKLKESVDKKISFELNDETRISGTLVFIENNSLIIKEYSKKDVTIVDFSMLNLFDLLSFINSNEENTELILENASLLLVTGNASAAEKEFKKASDKGAFVEQGVLDYIPSAKLVENEKRAGLAAQCALAFCEAKEWNKAVEKYKYIFSSEELTNTSFYKKAEKNLRKNYRLSLIEQEVIKGVKPLVKGKVKERGKNISVTYDFTKEEQAQDWENDNKSEDSVFEIKNSRMGIKGKINLKIHFVGDITVEANCLSSEDKPAANIGVFINDTGNNFYLMGAGFKIADRDNLIINSADKRPQRITLPANLILRYDRDLNSPTGFFASPVPKINKQTVYKLRSVHKDNSLSFSINGQEIGWIKEENNNDEKGMIGFFSYQVPVYITGVTITGKVDDDWLRKELEIYVDKTYSFTENDK
ncbi:MAG: hypothetical protein ABIH42_01115 [Planctomycetota bacterium]